MLRNVLCAVSASLALAGAAVAQVHQVVFELDLDDARNSTEVDTCVAANAKRAIVATNQRLSIHDLDGTNPRGSEMDYVWAQNSSGGLSTFPDDYLFEAVSGTLWRDPRVEWDPINGRFWITIIDAHTPGQRFHVAVSRDDSPSTFDLVNGSAGDWYVYTGDGTGGAHGAAFDMGELTDSFNGLPDHQVINIDKDHLWMVARDRCDHTCPTSPPPTPRGSVVSIPLEVNALSIMDGNRPSEAEFGIVHLDELQPGHLNDLTVSHYAVQEPFDQFAAAQFTINYAADASSGPTGYRDAIRLGAARWVSGALDYQWKDLTIDAASDRHFHAASNDPGTPKQDWNIDHVGAVFDSGVLFRDGDNNWRILAAHHVGVDSDPGGTPTQSDVTEFRWYLIDPDLDNYPGANWSPQIVEDGSGNQIIGRAPTGNVVDPHTYQGAIALNDEGAAYITFTRSGSSSSNGWPSLVRARLTADYSDIQYEDSTSSEQGPGAWLGPDSSGNPVGTLGWAYADMQAAVDHCGYWAMGTLVADPGDSTIAPYDKRAIWLTEILPGCNNNAEMNGDGTVDAADLALYLDHYAKGAPQADMDGDSTVDAVDSIIYSDEYAKR